MNLNEISIRMSTSKTPEAKAAVDIEVSEGENGELHRENKSLEGPIQDANISQPATSSNIIEQFSSEDDSSQDSVSFSATSSSSNVTICLPTDDESSQDSTCFIDTSKSSSSGPVIKELSPEESEKDTTNDIDTSHSFIEFPDD